MECICIALYAGHQFCGSFILFNVFSLCPINLLFIRLPVSNFGTQLAYLPFFISLAGIYTGPAFILYWLVYTLVGAILTKIGKYMYSYIIQKQDNSDILSETDDDDGEVDESE